MWFLVVVLVFLRLLMWHIYPQIGISHYSDIVFGTICLTALVIYGFYKQRMVFSPPLILLVLATTVTTYLNGCQDMQVKTLFTFDIYMLMVLAVQMIETKKTHWLLGCLVGYALLSAGYGVYQILVLHLHRAPGLQGWPLSLAGQLLLFMPWALSRVGLRSIVICLGFLSSFSVLPALSLMALYLRNRWVLFLVVCLSIPAIYFKDLLGAWDTRVGYYQRALEYLARHPILGVGAGQYVYSDSSPSVFVHNSYLQIWIEQGFLGFVAILWLVATIVRHPLIRRTQWVWLGICAFLIDNLFSYTLLKANTSFLFWVMFAIYVHLYTKENSRS